MGTSLRRLFDDGRLLLTERPGREAKYDRAATAIIEDAFARHALAVAGPSLGWQPTLGFAAVRVFEWATWMLFDLAVPREEMQQLLKLPRSPRSAEEHLSVDLTFQYLSTVLRRARASGGGDGLADTVADVLRHCPLSGVLADLPDGPAAPLDFAGHPGLQLLYAERLAEHFSPGWVPAAMDRTYVELVWSEQGRDVRLLKTPTLEARDDS